MIRIFELLSFIVVVVLVLNFFRSRSGAAPPTRGLADGGSSWKDMAASLRDIAATLREIPQKLER